MESDDDSSDSGSSWGESSCPIPISSSGRIVTFSQDMDALFSSIGPSPAPAGIPLGQVTELCGAAGVGKTTLALQLALDVQMPAAFGGAGGGTLFVDTEGGFFPERLFEMAAALSAHVTRKAVRLTEGAEELAARVAPAALARNVRVYRATTIEGLAAAVEAIPKLIAAEKIAAEKAESLTEPQSIRRLLPVRLVVIDSVALHLRHVLGPMDPGARVRATATLGAALHSLAATAGVAVVVVNHVTTKIGHTGGGVGAAAAALAAAAVLLPPGAARGLALDAAPGDTARLVPALGDVWAHVPAARLWLGWQAGHRVATIDKSLLIAAVPLHMTVSTFSITAAGIRKVSGREART